jgi:hypothetical protein
MAVKTPQGLTCGTVAVVDAAAAVELSINEPAMHAPTTPFKPSLAISILRQAGTFPAQLCETISPQRSFIPPI